MIDGRDGIYSVAFLVDGKHVVSGGREEEIRRWRIEDGKEVGTPMDAGNDTLNIAVPRDGKWIVSGTRSLADGGECGESRKSDRVPSTRWHHWVRAVDVSPDATTIVTGSDD